jgi:large subunit ribosomal protein L10
VKQLTRAAHLDVASTRTYAVVKNTLTELAAKEAGVTLTAFDGQLVGPTAIAFVRATRSRRPRRLRDFAKANPLLVIKGGVLDGKPSAPTRSRSSPTSSPARFSSPSWPAP